jgi:hypothetical protein
MYPHMCKPNDAVQAHPYWPGFFDNSCAVFAPPGHGMRHNGRTPEGVGTWPATIPRERELARQNGGPRVRCETVDTSPEGPRTNGE